MPFLNKPTNDEGRLNLVKTSLKTNQSDSESGPSFLTEETVSKATTVSTNFESALLALTGTLADRSREVNEKNLAVSRLELFIRDLWEVTKRRVYRNHLPADVLAFYSLPLSGIVPSYINEKEIFPLATQIIEGDKKAVIAGFPAAVNPSAPELAVVLAAAIKEASEVAPADRKMNKAQEALAEQRLLIEEVINDIIDDLTYSLRKKEPSVSRRIMRTYGITFGYAVGEPEDEPAASA